MASLAPVRPVTLAEIEAARDRIKGVVLRTPLVRLDAGPAHVLHKMGNRIIVGEPSGPATPRLEALATALRAGGIETDLSAAIQRDIWFKLWGNMTMNPISALTRATCDLILDDSLTQRLTYEVMREAARIGAALGIDLGMSPEQRSAITRKLGRFKSSMLQDLEAGRTLEVEALVGAPYEIAGLVGLDAPWLGMLYGLVRQLAADVAAKARR